MKDKKETQRKEEISKMSSNSSKLLIVSKTIFHTLNNCDEMLCSFVKNYNVVLPYTLAIECVISEPGKKPDKEPEKLIRGLYKSIQAGAKIGYQSPELLSIEMDTQGPIESVINEARTQQYKNSAPEIYKDRIIQATNSYKDVTQRKIDELLERAKRLYKVISKDEEFMKLFDKLRRREERYQMWVQIMDHKNFVKNVVKKDFTEKISSRADTNWYTWQLTRLWCAYCLDWSYKKSLPCSCEKKDISNDFYDIEPVLYLLRADGLLTNDQKLEIPLAKAAYPQKIVFEVDTRLNNSRNVKNIYDDIVNIIPQSYRL